MGKIIVSENMTLDASTSDPMGEEGAAGGGWFARMSPTDREAFGQAALAEALAADAFLMGRRSYEFLASRWPGRTGALADRLNAIPKYVVSATMRKASWNNTTIIGDDPVTRIVALKQQIAGVIVVPASFQLVTTLLAHDLVDELRILVFPVVRGVGGNLFGESGDQVSLHLLTQRRLGEHLTESTYAVAGRG